VFDFHRIYEERVQEVDNEIRMVEEGTHPQFLAMLEPVNKRRDENIQLANAKFNYAVQSLDTWTKATRAQIHSQYFQGIRHLREKYLSMVSANWYQIQRERRASDTLVPGMLGFAVALWAMLTFFRLHIPSSRKQITTSPGKKEI
jgi:hypothetical protein